MALIKAMPSNEARLMRRILWRVFMAEVPVYFFGVTRAAIPQRVVTRCHDRDRLSTGGKPSQDVHTACLQQREPYGVNTSRSVDNTWAKVSGDTAPSRLTRRSLSTVRN